MSSGVRIAADIGGTFTDIACLLPDGELSTCKVPSTPHDYAQAIIEGIETLTRSLGLRVDGSTEVLHASTVATNAILEGKGANTALVTTEGFRDVLELRRIRVPRLYEPLYEKPPPLVPRRRRYEVRERLDAQGAVVTPLDEAQVRALASKLAETGVEAVAISLLHAYANPEHERKIAELMHAVLPGCFISVSSDVLPEIREYERTSTTVINAYIGPVMSRYLQSLRQRLSAHRIGGRLLMMQSSGGTMDVEQVIARPAMVVESGPAAGVIGAARLGKRAGYENIITFDMGGTTAKASLIEEGAVVGTDEYEVGGGISLSSRLAKGGGYALKLPVIDVSEVGAGGGSIVHIDAGGMLKVGPESAGASPGPACYGRGGAAPTVTDASVVLGYLNPDALAGGTLPIQSSRARAALEEKVARPLEMDVLEAAYGIHRLVNSTMMRAVKAVSTYRGRDPREFTLFAFGGNGGIHAAALATELQMRQVIVPPGAGVFSAVGLLFADLESKRSMAFLRALNAESVAQLPRHFEQIEQQALAEVAPGPGLTVHWHADLRYAGQGFEVPIEIWRTDMDAASAATTTNTALAAAENSVAAGKGAASVGCAGANGAEYATHSSTAATNGAAVGRGAARVDANGVHAAANDIRERFEREYRRLYGHELVGHPIDFVALRVTVTVPPRGVSEPSRMRRALFRAARAATRKAYFGREHGLLETPVIDRRELSASPRPGPLIIEEYEGTTVVPPNASASRDSHDNIVITLSEERSRAQ